MSRSLTHVLRCRYMRRRWVGGVLVAALAATGVCNTTEAFDYMTQVRDIAPGEPCSYPTNLTDVAGTLYFTADDGSFGRELWRSDGTRESTRLVADISPGPLGSSLSSLTSLNTSLYFVAANDSDEATLWTSDGTPRGTRAIKTFSTKPFSNGVYSLTVAGDLLYFLVDGADGTQALWRSNGTVDGTFMLTEHAATELTAMDGVLAFTLDDAIHGRELWQTDGTVAGTHMVADINPGIGSSFPSRLTNVDGTVFFVANNNPYRNGRELWRSDGTAAGTGMVADINPGDASSEPTDLTAMDSTLYFTAYRPGTGRELWRSDGTQTGTRLVRDITAGGASSQLSHLRAVDHTLFFVAATNSNDPWSEHDVWRSDGTAEGTLEVKKGLYDPSTLTTVGKSLFFLSTDPFGAQSVWRSDGSGNGTRIVGRSENGELTAAGTHLFTASSSTHRDTELWSLPTDPSDYRVFSVYLPLVIGQDAYPGVPPDPSVGPSETVVPVEPVPVPTDVSGSPIETAAP